MSLETTGTAKSNDFQTSQATVEGFVKNDAAGNFSFGETGSGWTLVETKGPLAAAGDVIFTGLNGDVDFAYRLIFILDGKFLSTPGGRVRMQLNSIAQVSQDRTITTRIKFNGTKQTFVQPGVFLAQWPQFESTTIYGDYEFHARTGKQRILQGFHTERNLVGASSVQLHARYSYSKWADETTNITSLRIFGTITAGSVWSLYKIKRT